MQTELICKFWTPLVASHVDMQPSFSLDLARGLLQVLCASAPPDRATPAALCLCTTIICLTVRGSRLTAVTLA